MAGGTGIVPLGSELKRKAWMREGMVQAASKSFWSPMTGNSKDSVVYQENNISAGSGHTVVFDFDGNLTGKAIKGKEQAYGKGEQKRKFSDKITVERYRIPVDNGDKFDGVDIGDLSINEHMDSRNKLGDLWIRWKDQAIFDATQGNLGQAPSHVIDLVATFDFAALLRIEKVIKTSNGYDTGGVRRPLDPYKLQDGQKCWLFIIDSAMANLLRTATNFQAIVQHGDVRGSNNMNIKGVIAKLGALLIIEADQFFGETEGTATGWGLDDSSVEISGLRQYAGADPATAPWTGQTGFDYAHANLHSRGIILGNGGVQFAMGKMPDYRLQSSTDFAISSESCLEVWTEVKKTNMTAENDDYTSAKIAGLDFGVVAVDVEVQ